MKGNFYSTLNRKNSDTTVDARGWMEWDNGDPDTVYLEVTITQDGRSGRGTCGPYRRPGPNKPTTIEWRCDVPEENGQDFDRDVANANAAWQQNLGTQIGSWSATPMLN